MTPDMIQKVIGSSVKAIETNFSDRDIAAAIRKTFQSLVSTSTWHCFVGRDLGCYVTHKEGLYIYLYIGQLGICLFAT